MVDNFWQDGPMDMLVNNAAGNFLCRTEELSIGAFEAVIGIVLMGTIHVTMACGKRWIKEGRKANVLNITTTYAESGSPYVVPSSVAKAGVLKHDAQPGGGVGQDTESASTRLRPARCRRKARSHG